MISPEKRQRHKEGHRSRIAAAREAEERARRRRTLVRAGGALALVAVVAAGVWFLTGRDDGDDEAGADETTTTVADEETTSTAALPPAPEGTTIEGETPCPPEEGSAERVASFEQAPPMCIDPAVPLEADIVTTAGTVTIALDPTTSPETVNNFVVLARYRFYDGIPFHRLVPGFVAQVGGSGEPGPDGTPDYGSTGPGYDGVDGEAPAEGYTVGDVAMARSDVVSGSQFFIVTTEEGAASLEAGQYPLLGRVVAGLDVAVALADSGDPDQPAGLGGAPLELHTIESITVRPAA